MEQPLAIAGAGIAGLALAAGLQRAESATPYLLLEERPELGGAGGAITLWPNAIAALDEIGVGDDVRRAGYPLGAGTISTSRGRVLRSLDLERSVAALGGPLIAVRRGDLIDILHAQIKPGSVMLGIAVRG
jgi:2-polyprenyl-6-methoxyphenol hydroxylase-like FAD-dependent oxidoreductase